MARVLRAAPVLALLLARPSQGQEFLKAKVDVETAPQTAAASENKTLTQLSRQLGASSYYAYEDGGKAMVSSPGSGDDFWAHEEFRFVRTVKVWQDPMRRRRNARRRTPIGGLSITYHGSTTEHRYGTTDGAWAGDVTFQPGDTLSSLAIWNNPDGNPLPGKIEMRTSGGQSLSVGAGRQAYNYAVAGQLFSGFRGFTRNVGGPHVIMGLQPLVWHPVDSMVMVDVSYNPALTSLPPLTEPTLLRRFEGCNAASVPVQGQQVVLTNVHTTRHSACFTNTVEESTGVHATVSAGIPGIVEVSEGFEFTETETHGSENCNEEEMTRTEEITMPSQTIPPNTQLQIDYQQYGGRQDISYTGNMEVHFQQNVVPPVRVPVSGSYEGVAYSTVVTSAREVPMTRCGAPTTTP